MSPVAHNDILLSVVVPIYNEEELVDSLHLALSDVLENIGESWEIVYIDDGSTDSSLELSLKHQMNDARVTVVELSRNWGHRAALTAGLQVARGAAVILVNADLEDRLEVLPSMVEAWREGAQVVVGHRSTHTERGFRRFIYPLFYKFLGFLSEYPIPLNANILGLLDRQVVDSINALTETNRHLPGLRAWFGFHTSVLYYKGADCAAGQPQANLLAAVRCAVFGFSYKPFRLSLLLALPTALLAILYGSALVFTRFAGIQLSRALDRAYTSTIMSVLFMGAAQLICIGLLGEYIGRIYNKVKQRPLFLVRAIHRAESKFHLADGTRDRSLRRVI